MYGGSETIALANGHDFLGRKTDTKVLEMTQPVGDPTGFHGQFRHGRMLKNGNFLIAHMDMGKVTEYDSTTRKPVWNCGGQPSAWGAVRLNNGNTLISGNGGGWVREISPDCKTVWEVTRNELPGITLQTVQETARLANGNTLICSWNNGGTSGLQTVEVTPEKRVVWAMKSWKNPNLGSASSLQLLDEPGLMENGELQRKGHG